MNLILIESSGADLMCNENVHHVWIKCGDLCSYSKIISSSESKGLKQKMVQSRTREEENKLWQSNSQGSCSFMSYIEKKLFFFGE